MLQPFGFKLELESFKSVKYSRYYEFSKVGTFFWLTRYLNENLFLSSNDTHIGCYIIFQHYLLNENVLPPSIQIGLSTEDIEKIIQDSKCHISLLQEARDKELRIKESMV